MLERAKSFILGTRKKQPLELDESTHLRRTIDPAKLPESQINMYASLRVKSTEKNDDVVLRRSGNFDAESYTYQRHSMDFLAKSSTSAKPRSKSIQVQNPNIATRLALESAQIVQNRSGTSTESLRIREINKGNINDDIGIIDKNDCKISDNELKLNDKSDLKSIDKNEPKPKDKMEVKIRDKDKKYGSLRSTELFPHRASSDQNLHQKLKRFSGGDYISSQYMKDLTEKQKESKKTLDNKIAKDNPTNETYHSQDVQNIKCLKNIKNPEKNQTRHESNKNQTRHESNKNQIDHENSTNQIRNDINQNHELQENHANQATQKNQGSEEEVLEHQNNEVRRTSGDHKMSENQRALENLSTFENLMALKHQKILDDVKKKKQAHQIADEFKLSVDSKISSRRTLADNSPDLIVSSNQGRLSSAAGNSRSSLQPYKPAPRMGTKALMSKGSKIKPGSNSRGYEDLRPDNTKIAANTQINSDAVSKTKSIHSKTTNTLGLIEEQSPEPQDQEFFVRNEHRTRRSLQNKPKAPIPKLEPKDRRNFFIKSKSFIWQPTQGLKKIINE